MNEWYIYTLISLAMALLFILLMRRQQVVYQRRWLIKKIQQEPQQESYVTALSKLKTNPKAVIKATTLVVLLVVPVSLFLNYKLFSNYEAQQQQQQQQNPPSIEQAIAQLKEKLADNPNDLEGQLLYARTMMSMQQFDAAVKALEKANELAPNDANILTDLAEATAFKNQNGSFLGQPEDYLKQALALNPNQQKAMWLQGIVAYEKDNFAAAENIWTRLISQIDDNKVKATILKQINQARTAQNKQPIETRKGNAQNGTQNGTTNTVAKGKTYKITIDADARIKAQSFPATARLFIAAKVPSESPMPVAAMDIAPPFQWPLTVELSDQHNLTANRSLSDYAQISLTVKLSISGDAGTTDYQADAQWVSPDMEPFIFSISP